MQSKSRDILHDQFVASVFLGSPEDLTCCIHSADQCHWFRATLASCWEKSSHGNLCLLPTAVILSHAESPLDEQATSVLANQTVAELQHGHMVVWIGCCQHGASWDPHPAPAWQLFRAITVLWTRVEFTQFNVKRVFLNYGDFHFLSFNFETVRSSLDFLWVRNMDCWEGWEGKPGCEILS